MRYSPVLFLTADGNTCLFHELTPWRSYHLILLCISTVQSVTVHHFSGCGLLSPGSPPCCLPRPESTLCSSVLIMAGRQRDVFTPAWRHPLA